MDCEFVLAYNMIKCSGCHGDLDSKFPKFTFRISGFDMVLNPRQYIIKYYNTCLIKISKINFGDHNMAILGMMFMKQYYTLFDQDAKTIGFAKAV